MAGRTPNFNLSSLNAGDDFSLDGYKFTDADRVLVDRLLHAALTHDHSGDTPDETGATVDARPTLTLDPTTGSLPAGVRLYYRIALVAADGLPTVASPETVIDTPQPITPPGPPTAQRSITDGTLRPGVYYYRVSAYRAADTLETAAGDAVTVNLPANAGSTQRILLTLPTLPTGATGFNIYRRAPGGSAYVHVATVDLDHIDSQWVDDGSINANCERFAPIANTTSSSNSIEIGFPGGTVPDGYTWRIYRTDTPADWTNSLLIDVIEETAEGSGIITPVYTDMGIGTTAGSPPLLAPPNIPTPGQISYADILDAPAALPAIFPAVATINIADASDPAPVLWVCPYPQAKIRAVQIGLATMPADPPPPGTTLTVNAMLMLPGNPIIEPTVFGSGAVATAEPLDVPRNDNADLTVSDLIEGDLIAVGITDNTADWAIGLTVQILLWVRDPAPEITWPELP